MATSSRIANYQPEELLASAGPVDTFRARAKDREQLIALKVFFLDRAGGDQAEGAARRFLAAGRRLLESPLSGAAQVLEVSDEPEAAFIASEFVAGIDLASLLALVARKGARLDGIVAGLLCADVAETLAAAHAAKAPLFHLGLCPGDIVVTRTAVARVLDFGLTAALRTCVPLPMEKWLFVAPELVGAEVAALPPSAAVAGDVYALGAILHVLLGGALPALGSSLSDLRKRKSAALPEVAGAPKHLQAAVRALTAPEPRDRPDSVQTAVAWLSNGIASGKERQLYVASALESLGIDARGTDAAASRADVPARPAPGVAPAAVAARPPRRRWLWAGVATLIVVAAAGTGLWSPFATAPEVPRIAAKGAEAPKQLPSLRVSQAEVVLAAARDGGATGAPQPADRVYLPGPKQKLPRVPGHLFLATTPDQADVWVDGILKGKTPVDLAVGPGGHRVVAVKPGFRMLRAVYDTTEGEYVRKDLQRAPAPSVGDAFLDIECQGSVKLPVFVDDEETGLVCPARRVPVRAGKHSVGVFVPAKRSIVAVEVTAVAGLNSTRVVLKD